MPAGTVNPSQCQARVEGARPRFSPTPCSASSPSWCRGLPRCETSQSARRSARAAPLEHPAVETSLPLRRSASQTQAQDRVAARRGPLRPDAGVRVRAARLPSGPWTVARAALAALAALCSGCRRSRRPPVRQSQPRPSPLRPPRPRRPPSVACARGRELSALGARCGSHQPR